MSLFNLVSKYSPSIDQKHAIDELVKGYYNHEKHQVLLGATGTGKTFTVANVIQKLGKQTLIMAHNKTLASQLFAELKSFFPNNRVEYYISYFDYYKPEAYKPAQDLYIDKQSIHNSEIEMMRISTMDALMSRDDVIVVSSVASIYGARDPNEWSQFRKILKVGEKLERKQFLYQLVKMGYDRNDQKTVPGSFMVKGDVIFISPSWTDAFNIRVELFGDEIENLSSIDPLNNNLIERFDQILINPAEQSVIKDETIKNAISLIESDLQDRLKYFKDNNLILEYERLKQRTRFDIEQLSETGTCSGIENYSIYFEPSRSTGDTPFTLFNYFKKDFLLVVDESHISLPQIKGMYEGDRSRKQTLVDYGFRLPSALDNRPLKFHEFEKLINSAIYVSATPAEYEVNKANKKIIRQIIRPTGLLDPVIVVKPTLNQVDDLIEQIRLRKSLNERIFVNVITKKMAEDISDFLSQKGINVTYLHSDLKTFERNEVIRKLRVGIYDVVVGINLLKEGLDVPEVSLMAIFDADKEGYLRNDVSLIQIIGRVARNSNALVIMYADKISRGMESAIAETKSRRETQIQFNKLNNIVPKTIFKEIPMSTIEKDLIKNGKIKVLGKKQLESKIKELEKQMYEASKKFDFERAIELRDLILELKSM